MKNKLSDLIREYYEVKKNEKIFVDIITCCNKIINSTIKLYPDKEDMKQESILKIFKLLEEHKLDSVIDKTEKEIFSYIKIAINNNLIDVLKKNYKFFGHEVSVLFSELENVGEVIEIFSDLKFMFEDTLEELIKKLTKKQKKVMRFLYLDQLTENEIAKKLNVERQDINAIKNRAKKAMRANLTIDNEGVGKTPLCITI